MTDIDAVARTVYGEARGQPVEGQFAVANVIMNRARIGGWWGSTPESVARHPLQFSCWNDGDPNKPIIESVKPGVPAFDLCLLIAELVVKGMYRDPSNAATHYYATSIPAPAWAAGKTPCAKIGQHVFFRDIG
jgi:cell wall hydrolase